jgi:hypothetical protein
MKLHTKIWIDAGSAEKRRETNLVGKLVCASFAN